MIRWLLGLMLSSMTSDPLLALEFNRYHNQDEINTYLRFKSDEHPELIETNLLGYSHQGRPVYYSVISPRDNSAREAILINGTHHGNEKSSTESVLGLMEFLITERNSREVAQLLARYAIYIVPLVNPDGHAANSRTDAKGYDLNRDYAYPERSAEDSFKSESTRLIKQLTEQINFRAAIAYHSGMEAILWPSCYTEAPPSDRAIFRALAKTAAHAMGFKRYLQSYRDYPTQGEFIDFAYSTFGTLAITLEVSDDPAPSPSHLPAIVKRSITGAVAYMNGILDLSLGRLQIEDRSPSPFVSSRSYFEEPFKDRGPNSAHH